MIIPLVQWRLPLFPTNSACSPGWSVTVGPTLSLKILTLSAAESSTFALSTPGDTVSAHRSVRVAKPADLAFVIDLQRRWSNNVGFLPKCTFERYIDSHQLLLINENDDSAGYLSWTFRKDGLIRIPQVAIHPDLLRGTLGTRIMNRIAAAGIAGNCSIIRLRCRSDLLANAFWPSLGFTLTATIARPSSRGLPLLEWTKQLLSTTELARVLTAGKRPQRLYKHSVIPHVSHQHLEHTDA